MQGLEWHLARRPKGEPVIDDFSLVEVDVPEPADGEVLVRNEFISVDPYIARAHERGPLVCRALPRGRGDVGRRGRRSPSIER